MYFSDNPSDRYYERMMVGIPKKMIYNHINGESLWE